MEASTIFEREYIRIHEVSRDKDASGGIAEGSGIHTTFACDRATDTWSWTIDNVDKSGRASPFARMTLTRKK